MDSLFHEYDIRGNIKKINSGFARRLSTALAHYFKKGKFVIGYDARINSKELNDVLVKSLSQKGFEVLSIGLSTTPYFYHAVIESKADAGVMITASHLGKEMNGFKIVSEDSNPVSMSTGLSTIQKYFVKNKPFPKKKGKILTTEFIDSYKKLLGEDKYPYDILIDCSDGTGIMEANMLSEHFRHIKIINEEPDLEHAPHGPNPLDKASRFQAKKLAPKFNFTVIFDADEDRVIFLDELGNYHMPDVIGMLMAKNYDVVVRDITCTRFFGSGKKIIVSKVGRTNLQRAMKAYHADFGFEKSGHYYFKKFKYLDNAALAVLELAKVLQKKKMTLSQLVSEYPSYNYEIINIHKDNLDLESIERDLLTIRKGKTNNLDGLTFETNNCFVNIRKSNTEPIYRATLESRSARKLKKIKGILAKYS